MDISTILKDAKMEFKLGPIKEIDSEKVIDFKSFGVSKTYNIDFTPLPKKATESYTPKELSLPFKEVPYIFIGGCGGTDEFHFDGAYFNSLNALWGCAHTHWFPCDPLKGSICISHKKWVRRKDDVITDLMWHEYGHALSFPRIKVKHDENVINKHFIIKAEKDFMDDPSGHGSRWKRTMIKLGKPHLQTATVQMSDEDRKYIDI